MAHAECGGHSHSHDTRGSALGLGIALTSIILVVDVVIGLRSGSLALLSDALHVGTDLFALAIAWWAVRQSRRPADARRTFGYHRSTILAAIVNAVTLFVIVVFIAIEAAERFQDPPKVNALEVMPAALLSILVNLFILQRLHHIGMHDLNLRSAALHVIGDVGASIGVLVGAALIYFFNWTLVDPILSVLIAVLVVWEAWKILAEGTNVLMEGVPQGVDPSALAQVVRSVPGVKDLHDLHVWNISGNLQALSVHVVVEDKPLSECEAVLFAVERILCEQFKIGHTTIQAETRPCGEYLFCYLSESPHCTPHTERHAHQPHAHH